MVLAGLLQVRETLSHFLVLCGGQLVRPLHIVAKRAQVLRDEIPLWGCKRVVVGWVV